MFLCRSSMQKFCTSTVWYRPTKQNDVCSFHAMPFPVPFVYKALHKHILFPARQLSKTKGNYYPTQCPTGPIGSNLSKPANPQLLDMEALVSKVRKHGFQPLGPRLESIGSSNPRFLLRTFLHVGPAVSGSLRRTSASTSARNAFHSGL